MTWTFFVLRRLGSSLATPDSSQLVLLKEVDSCAVATDVEVLLHVSALLEPDLGQVSSSVVSEENLAAGFQQPVDVAHSLFPLLGREGREDENHQNHVDRAFRKVGWQLITCSIPDIGLHVFGVILVTAAHHLDSLLGEIAGMDLEIWIFIVCENGKSSITSAGTYF